MQRLQVKYEKPFILGACGHHSDEVILSGAFNAEFGDKTVSPFQTECQEFKKWRDANPDKVPKVLQYDEKDPPLSLDDPFLQSCREDLVKLQERLSASDGHCSLPRGDYVHLWDLIQVIDILIKQKLWSQLCKFRKVFLSVSPCFRPTKSDLCRVYGLILFLKYFLHCRIYFGY